ncbi:class I SAM-dependent methyltransferase [Sphingobacterium siyangense]|uniref:class I SAM-dependent methyltransferase n=1 Tax=Sphingobacterium siyangense TaxID=459529 RepID=UPI002010B286|nr:class I SAM-dependent methyltransferase [Sphingobacterium siyangense]UQA74101.1 class I SAM-dependent methyltransferase [Sphingobacterium siyangense]
MSKTNQSFWDERYGQEQYAYGEAPNEYLKNKLTGFPKGRILFPLEGEGRNAVFAAILGWNVFAFDQSSEGKKKAELLAKKNGVQIEYVVSDVADFSCTEKSFDALVLVYAHFTLNERRRYHQKLSSLLKKRGLLIIEGFGKEHIEKQKQNPNAGGPKEATMLYDLEDLKTDFRGFEFIEIYKTDTELQEGNYHVGVASVVRVLAIKK